MSSEEWRSFHTAVLLWTSWRVSCRARILGLCPANPTPCQNQTTNTIYKESPRFGSPGSLQNPLLVWVCYVGQTERSVCIRRQEHQRHLWLGNSEKSAIVDHGWWTGHFICFAETEGLYRSSTWSERLIRAALEIQSMWRVLNKEAVVNMSKPWLPQLSKWKNSLQLRWRNWIIRCVPGLLTGNWLAHAKCTELGNWK